MNEKDLSRLMAQGLLEVNGEDSAEIIAEVNKYLDMTMEEALLDLYREWQKYPMAIRNLKVATILDLAINAAENPEGLDDIPGELDSSD